MKANILCVSVFLGSFLLSCSLYSQAGNKSADKTIFKDTTKVIWEKDLTGAFAKAKAEGKLLFVDCFMPSCPVCQTIEPYFKASEVAKKYNTSFINYKLDVGVAAEYKYIIDRNIYLPSIPQFLFFDGDGKLVHQSEVNANTASIVGVANDALDPKKQSANYKARFDGGERSIDFLIKYAVFTKVIKDTTGNQIVANAIYDGFPKEQLNTEFSWGVTKKAVMTSIDNGFFKYWIDNMPLAASFEKKAGHAGQEVNTLGGIVQTSIFKDGRGYTTSQIQQVKGYMDKVGAGQYADSFLWEFETLANYRENKAGEALKVATAMAQKSLKNGSFLVYIVKVLNDSATDNSYLESASQWLKTAQPLVKENNQLAEYHYETARINTKLGKTELAKSSAVAALEFAKKAGIKLDKFEAIK